MASDLIKVLPPDINESADTFTVSGDNIRFGLAAVKSVGRGFVKAVAEERKLGGEFTSLRNFCSRMQHRELNRRALENLIKCGAFDSTGANRAQLLQIYDSVLTGLSYVKNKTIEGQVDLFSMTTSPTEPKQADEDILPNISEFPKKTILSFEKETLGIYLSGHPLDDYSELLKKIRTETVSDILNPDKHNDGDSVLIAGELASVRTKSTKSNSIMAYIVIEGTASSVEGIVFPKVLDKHRDVVRENSLVIVRGRISTKEDSPPQIICDEIKHISEYEHLNTEGSAESKTLYIKLPSEDSIEAKNARALASAFPGNLEMIMFYADTKKRIRTHVSNESIVFTRLREMLGEENVVLK